MQRHILGAIGLAMLLTLPLLLLLGQNETDWGQKLWNVSFKFGPLLVVIWLAYPQVVEILSRFSPIMFYAIVIGFAAIVLNPRLALVVIPAWVIIWFLQPKRYRAKPAKRGRTAKK